MLGLQLATLIETFDQELDSEVIRSSYIAIAG